MYNNTIVESLQIRFQVFFVYIRCLAVPHQPVMSSTTKSVNYGRRLLPTTLDELAINDPDRELYSIPLGATPKDGFQAITSSVYANAINRASWFMEKTWGKSTTFETIAYLGPSQYRHAGFVNGAANGQQLISVTSFSLLLLSKLATRSGNFCSV